VVVFFLAHVIFLANMTIAGTLEWVKFEWPVERTVRLHIRESVLTFST
jgi:hypothetical protein